MLNAYRNVEVKKRLAAWLCCSAKQAPVDYYLCQHCTNYAASETGASHSISIPEGNDLHGLISENQLEKAILCLLPDQRAVVYLKIGLGFSNQDVADFLRKSMGAVNAIQQRALVTLLHLLYPDY